MIASDEMHTPKLMKVLQQIGPVSERGQKDTIFSYDKITLMLIFGTLHETFVGFSRPFRPLALDAVIYIKQ